MLKKIGYGFIVWVVPYVTAIPLMGLMISDPTFFKTIMIVEGTIVGMICAVAYFNGVKKNYLQDSLVLGLVWLIVNWLLDFVLLIPFSKMPLDRYFLEIGLRYIGMLAPTVAIGYLLEKKLKA